MADQEQAEPPVNVEKGLGALTTELIQSLRVVRDSLRGLESGQQHQVIPLSGQLRGLLLERRKDSHALLLEVARRLGYEAKILVGREADAPFESALKDATLVILGFPFSLERETGAQRSISLGSLESFKLVKHEDKLYTVGNVVKWYANKAGGSHFAKNLPRTFALLLELDRVAPLQSAIH